MIYHFVVGDLAAAPLQEAINAEPTLQGEIVILKDILHVGPIQKEEGGSFSELRTKFWQEAAPSEKHPIQVDDMERLLEVSASMFKDDQTQAWFWMAPTPADVTAYFWLLPYLSKHPGRFYLINITGLPFLDEQGKVFYPKSFSQILPKQIIKARRLARQVTPSEIEVDIDDWNRLVAENGGVRIHEGGKKLVSKPIDIYDTQLLAACSPQFQKASKIVRQTMAKAQVPTGDLFLGWRLRSMAQAGTLQMQGNPLKPLNEIDFRLPGESVTEASVSPGNEQSA